MEIFNSRAFAFRSGVRPTLPANAGAYGCAAASFDGRTDTILPLPLAEPFYAAHRAGR